MRKGVRFLLVFILTISMVLGLTGCSSKKAQIKDTLSEFEYACRNLDTKAMLRCIDPDIADPIRLFFIGLSVITEKDYEDLVNALFDIRDNELTDRLEAKQFLSSITFTDLKIKAKRKTATVKCKTNFEIVGEQFRRNTTIKMIRDEDDDKWYISSFNLLSDEE